MLKLHTSEIWWVVKKSLFHTLSFGAPDKYLHDTPLFFLRRRRESTGERATERLGIVLRGCQHTSERYAESKRTVPFPAATVLLPRSCPPRLSNVLLLLPFSEWKTINALL